MTTDEKPDDVITRIDRAVRRGNGDPEPDSLEARLRLVVPVWAYWETTEPKMPPAIAQFLEQIGGNVVSRSDTGARPTTSTMWTEPRGVWIVKFREDSQHQGTYHLVVDGPDTDLHRDSVTVSEALELLAAVGAIKSTD